MAFSNDEKQEIKDIVLETMTEQSDAVDYTEQVVEFAPGDEVPIVRNSGGTGEKSYGRAPVSMFGGGGSSGVNGIMVRGSGQVLTPTSGVVTIPAYEDGAEKNPVKYLKEATISQDGNSLTIKDNNNETKTFTPIGGGGSSVTPSDAYPLEDGTKSAGSSTSYSRGDHRHPHDTTKADKSEMAITPGTGENSDKTTIQLKDGLSTTVLTQHQDITGKVDKVNGKGLSSNDYTTDEKNKLNGIENGAEKHKAPTSQEVKNALGTGSGTTKYLREDGQWAKPQDGGNTADVNYDSTNKKITKTIDGVTSDVVTVATLKNDMNLAKGDVGLGNVVNTGDSATPVSGGTTKFTTGGAYTELAKKVDKVAGKGLSTNDYTDADKSKLAGIAAGAEVNVQSDWNATSGDAVILNKPTIPTAVAVKGDAETSYRTGNVNITPTNIGLGNVGNFKAVSTAAGQGLSDTEKSNARTNIGAGTSNFSGRYNELSDKPTIPDAVAVKGDAESSYRTGNVNITEANICDKVYDTTAFSGLGKKYLPKNISDNKNILTQAMVNDTNTIYVIRYDYDLNGATISLKSNSFVEFDGGSLSNGYIDGVFSMVNDPSYKIFNGIEFIRNTCTFAVDFVRPEWFGAKGDYSRFTKTGTDDSTAINMAFHIASITGVRRVKFRAACYNVGQGVTINSGHIILEGVYASTIYDPSRKSSQVTDTGEIDDKWVTQFYGTGDYILRIGANATGPVIIRYITFVYLFTVLGVKDVSGIKFISESGGPLWPFIVEYCYFWGFRKAIEFQSANAYNVYDVDINRCAFSQNDFLVFFDNTNTPAKTGATNMIPEGKNFTYGLSFTNNNCIHNTRTLYINAVMGVVRVQRNDFEVYNEAFRDGTTPTGDFADSQAVFELGSNAHLDFSANYYEGVADLHPMTVYTHVRFSLDTYFPRISVYNNHFWTYTSEENDNYAIKIYGQSTNTLYPDTYIIIEKCQCPLHLYRNMAIMFDDRIPDVSIKSESSTIQMFSNSLDFPFREHTNNILYSYKGTIPTNGAYRIKDGDVYFSWSSSAIPVFDRNIVVNKQNVYGIISMKLIGDAQKYGISPLAGFTNDGAGSSFKVAPVYSTEYKYVTCIRRFTNFPNLPFYIAPINASTKYFYIVDAKFIEDDGDRYIGDFDIQDRQSKLINKGWLSDVQGMKTGEQYLSYDSSNNTYKSVIWNGTSWVYADGTSVNN